MNTIYLDGELTTSDKVNPKDHTLLGLFRPPLPISNGTWSVCPCPCGRNLWTANEVFEHWQSGHMDIPQYKNIK